MLKMSTATVPTPLLMPDRYSDAAQRVNAMVAAELEHQRRVEPIQCSYAAILLTPDQKSIQADLLPDGIHPSAPAWDALATACLDASLAQLLSRA